MSEYVLLLALISIPALFAVDGFRRAVGSYVDRVGIMLSVPLP